MCGMNAKIRASAGIRTCALSRWLVGEHHAELPPVAGRRAVGRVVDLEEQRRAGRQPVREAQTVDDVIVAGGVSSPVPPCLVGCKTATDAGVLRVDLVKREGEI